MNDPAGFILHIEPEPDPSWPAATRLKLALKHMGRYLRLRCVRVEFIEPGQPEPPAAPVAAAVEPAGAASTTGTEAAQEGREAASGAAGLLPAKGR